jgi:predicted Zn-dependent peptidase
VNSKRVLLAGVMFASTFAISSASQTPRRKPATQTIEQRLEKTEKQMADLAASHEKTMAKLKLLEDRMDAWLKALQDMHKKLVGK